MDTLNQTSAVSEEPGSVLKRLLGPYYKQIITSYMGQLIHPSVRDLIGPNFKTDDASILKFLENHLTELVQEEFGNGHSPLTKNVARANTRNLFERLTAESSDVEFFDITRAICDLFCEGECVVLEKEIGEESSAVFYILGDHRRVGNVDLIGLPVARYNAIMNHFDLFDGINRDNSTIVDAVGFDTLEGARSILEATHDEQ